MKVSVKEEHIKLGVQCNANSCPISIAICEDAEVNEVQTSLAFIRKKMDDGQVFIYKTPANAQQFVKDFDNGKPVKPIEFEVTEVNYYKIQK